MSAAGAPGLPHAGLAFGLRIGATATLPGLAHLPGAAPMPDVVVELQTSPPWPGDDRRDPGHALYRSPDRDERGRPLVAVDRLPARQGFRVRYADGIEFLIDAGGRRIRARWPEPWTVDDAATYLLGPVFAFALRLRGVTCLHASAVAIGGRAVAFVGPPGAGKSTLAAAFARRGHAVMSDDVLALSEARGGTWAHPGPSRIRLWPETVCALYGAPDALPRLTPTWDKRFVDLTTGGHRFQDRALPLGAIYVIGARGSRPAPARLAPMSAAEGLMALVGNTQANHLLDAPMRAQEFRSLGRLAASVPVRRIVAHDDVTRLPALCEAILDDLHAPAAHV